MVWGWDQKNHVSKWREGWLEQRQRVVVFVCNPNQREAGPSLNWEKAQHLKKVMKEEPVLWKESVCLANQHYLVIGEPLGKLEAGRFELVLKGLEKNVKYMNTEYKKFAQMGWLMRFLVFPSSGQKEMPKKNCSISVLLYLSSKFPMNIDSLLSLCPSTFLLMKRRTLGAERWGVQAGLAWGVQSCQGAGWEGGPWGSICCVFMTLYKSHREWWKRPWTGCQETRFPVVAWLLTSCVASDKAGFLGLSFLSCQTRLTGFDGLSALKCCGQIPLPRPWKS